MINGSSSFNDTAAARAAFNMGILNLSPEKFADLPENAQLKKDIAANKYTPEALPSKHWSGVVPTMCGAVTWKTPYIK